jgi:enamine deaminase RidA (YjgF/YER057c/UK114 family)
MKSPLVLACLGLLLAAARLDATDTPAGAPALKTDKYRAGKSEDDYGYRRAVRIGNTLYVSGAVGAGEMPAAIRTAYGTLGKTLAHYGLGFQHVVKENIFTTKLDALKESRAVRKEFYGTDFPAATWVQVDRLFQPDYVIEVELIAVFPGDN